MASAASRPPPLPQRARAADITFDAWLTHKMCSTNCRRERSLRLVLRKRTSNRKMTLVLLQTYSKLLGIKIFAPLFILTHYIKVYYDSGGIIFEDSIWSKGTGACKAQQRPAQAQNRHSGENLEGNVVGRSGCQGRRFARTPAPILRRPQPALFPFQLPPPHFPVRRKFPTGGDAGGNITALRAHDGRRHGRLLAAADLKLGGLGLLTDTGLYFTEINLGTPPKHYYLQVDTGSDIL
ncbi:aspartic proteinase-like protein 2 [Panicum miliaceum]|uniref:Aspartic proteinase-like protein 2 n=1 Tax=Panicum miliaceum TaxID=4540 RepID=A0A3L6Q557_PANMI|nr:aspartic proteinase-like protein 2 [Panicum miliaceum]